MARKKGPLVIVQIYKHNSPKRKTFRAAFAKQTTWGPDRADHTAQNWDLIEEVDLAAPGRALPFSPEKAAEILLASGVFLFQDLTSEMDKYQHDLLNEYRLKFTIPLFYECGEAFHVLGTGTLFQQEDRYFIVTADHIFRFDEKNPESPLIDLASVGVPTDPRPAGAGAAEILKLGSHNIYQLPPPTLVDAIVVEIRDPAMIATLKKGWSFLPFSQAEDVGEDDDRFVITGFMFQNIDFNRETNIVSQSFLNLETDYLHFIPAVTAPVPQFDVFFYLQADVANVDGTQRKVTTLKGLSGGPIWAIRDIVQTDLWVPYKAMKIVAIQSAELQSEEKWSRGVRWSAVQQILRQPCVGLKNPP